MKHLPLTLLAIAATAGFAGCQTQERAVDRAGGGRVQVGFEQPERFTDVRTTYSGSPDQGLLEGLRTFLQREAGRYLDPQETLALTFRDVDLAGDFEPWRGAIAMDVRIIKDIYPPRLEFSYVVTDADANIVREGRERLTDLAFNWRIGLTGREDPLYHEKALLREWLGRVLR